MVSTPTTDLTNWVWGPSFWDDNSAGSPTGGNNAEKIPSFLRLIGYPATSTLYPKKIGIQLQKGCPFIQEKGLAAENEIYCGSNFGT